MVGYRVSFCKDLLSSDGHRFRCLQGRIVIRRARSAERAMKAAQWRFERQTRIRHWKLHADLIEIETIEEGVGEAGRSSAKHIPGRT